MAGAAIGPCGCRGQEHEAAVRALVAMTEAYGCGDFSPVHLQSALAAGQFERVAEFVNGTWVPCGGGSGWCHATLVTPQQIRRFSHTAELFTTAITYGIVSPHYVFERGITNDPRVHARVAEIEWACGRQSTSGSGLNNELGQSTGLAYGTITISLTSPPTPADLLAFQQVTVDLWTRWAERPIDPVRITVQRGPDWRVNTPSHPKTILPTVSIKIAPPRGRCES